MREHRLSYSSPSGDIASGVMVCVITVPAFHIPKLGLGFPVAFVDAPTGETLFAGITWIDSHHRHTGLLGLILDKGTKLTKAPVMQAFPLRFVGLNPCPDMLEIFKSNAETGAFRSRDDAFGDTMVLVFLKPFLPAAYVAKAAFSGPCAEALQGGASFGVTLTVGLDFSPTVPLTQAVSGDIDNTEIHTQHALRGQQFGIVKVTYSGQIPLAAHEHQIDFALAVFKQLALVIATNIANLFSTRQKPQGDFLITDKAQDTVIIGMRRMLTKGALGFLVKLVGVRHFSNAAHRHLSGQCKFGVHGLIAELMQIVLPECLRFPSALREPVARFITARQRQTQLAFLRWSWRQFEVSYQLHKLKYRVLLWIDLSTGGFLPPPEGGALQPQFL
ncbi:hypothetical protein HW44_11210 [Nitrosococcus oceani]|nr:hypothetical protein HW44_11210 [Nitrosococcus oceani]